MTDCTRRDEIKENDSITPIRGMRYLPVCIECKYCMGSIIRFVDGGSNCSTTGDCIGGYICSNPSKTGAVGKEIVVKNLTDCPWNSKNIWAYENRGELLEENKRFREELKSLKIDKNKLEIMLFDRDEYINELQNVLKVSRCKYFQEPVDQQAGNIGDKS